MDERELVGLGGLVVLFLLLALRMPVGIAMVVVGIGGNWALSLAAPFLRFEPYLAQFKTLLWGVMANYDLSVVPLFVLMGYLASNANLARDLFQGAAAALGSLRGGVAMAAVGACGGFGAVCGSSLATAATMGRVALPELRRLHYSPRLATGALAAGGTLGILIPPSIALVIYAIITEASIIEMFQAAVIPGLIAILFFIGVIAVQVRLDPSLAPEPERLDRAARRAAYRRMVPVLLIFGAIILGLGFGLFTPTPAAAIGAFVVLAYGVWLRVSTGEGLGVDGILDALRQTAVTSGMIYLILFGAEVLKGFFGRSDLPASLAGWAGNSGLDPLAAAGRNAGRADPAWLLHGLARHDPGRAAVPLARAGGSERRRFRHGRDRGLWPRHARAEDLVRHPGADRGGVGADHAAVGLNVFIISSLDRDTPMAETFRGVLPFLAVELARVGIVLTVPALALTLPALLSG